MIYVYDRSTSPSRWEPTARSAPSTPSTRSPNTRRVRIPSSDREREDMMPSSQVSVARPSPSSERSPRLPRRSLSSLNAPFARLVDLIPLSAASHSFSERRMSPRVAPSSERYWLKVTVSRSLKLQRRHTLKRSWLIAIELPKASISLLLMILL